MSAGCRFSTFVVVALLGGCSSYTSDSEQAQGGGTREREPVAVAEQALTLLCGSAAQCDDGEACTIDLCVVGVCVHSPNLGCCEQDSDCNQDLVCNAATCVLNVCVETPITGCGDEADAAAAGQDSGAGDAPDLIPIDILCAGDDDCDDADPCTDNVCLLAGGVCLFPTNPLCCAESAQCAGLLDCHAGECIDQRCHLSLVPECTDGGSGDGGSSATVDAATAPSDAAATQTDSGEADASEATDSTSQTLPGDEEDQGGHDDATTSDDDGATSDDGTTATNDDAPTDDATTTSDDDGATSDTSEPNDTTAEDDGFGADEPSDDQSDDDAARDDSTDDADDDRDEADFGHADEAATGSTSDAAVGAPFGAGPDDGDNSDVSTDVSERDAGDEQPSVDGQMTGGACSVDVRAGGTHAWGVVSLLLAGLLVWRRR